MTIEEELAYLREENKVLCGDYEVVRHTVFAEVLAAACPFCITMFDDGIKGVEAEEKMQVEDIAEIVARAIEGDSTSAP